MSLPTEIAHSDRPSPSATSIDTAKLLQGLQSLRQLDTEDHELDRELSPALRGAATLVEFDPRDLLAAFGLLGLVPHHFGGVPYDFISVTTGMNADGEPTLDYNLDTKRARMEVRASRTHTTLVRELVAKASNDTNRDVQIRRTLFDLLVPIEIEPFLGGTTEMLIELDPGTAAVPWELLDTGLGGDPRPWSIRSKLLRKLRTAELRGRPSGVNNEGGALVIGEPLVDQAVYAPLPGARAEAIAVAETLRSPKAGLAASEVRALTSGSDDARDIINALLERPYRIIHVAGHGLPGPKGGVVLSGQTVLGPVEIAAMRMVPELVFLNCSHLAAFDVPSLASHDRAGFAANIAEALIRIGVRCVVAAGWAVEDGPAQVFAKTFYERLLDGGRFIAAVAAAREAAWRANPQGNTWAAYQCYGDPDWTWRRGDAPAARGAMADEYAAVSGPRALLDRLLQLSETPRQGGSDQVEGAPPPRPWRLMLVERQRIVREAGLDALREARRRLRGSASAAQRMADALLFGTLSELSALSIGELAALNDVRSWYEGTVAPLPDKAAVRLRLALAQLLEPMRRLIGDHFVGRTAELAQLTDYVDVLGPSKVLGFETFGRAVRYFRHVRRTLIDNPPLFVAGPGGVGKSSLLARFILDHVDAPQGADLPFVMLDFDRAQVEPRMPLSLLVAALHQLQVQFPQHRDAMLRMAEHLAQMMRGSDAEALESVDSSQATLVADFASQVDEMFGGEDDPRCLLWVLDTFEEPQRLGASTVGALWELMNSLQQELPRLRLVVCGRVVPQGFKWDVIALDEFDDVSAKAYLRKRLEAIGAAKHSDDKTLAQTIKVVGRTPLALRLAARLLADDDRKLLSLKLKREHVQGILFHRVLDHIRVDGRLESSLGTFSVNDVERRLLEQELRQLVYPGLAVRRVTPGVIEHVLAGPCGVKLRDPEHLARLFSALAQQVDIVEPGDTGGAEPTLLHRTDVRRMMLRDLEHEAGETLIRRIDRLAVIYHARRENVPDRAEEIYHRLRRHESEKVIRSRWQQGVEACLTTALDEIAAPTTRVMLAELLGVTLDTDDLADAEYDSWEQQAMRRATEYLRAGNPERALSVLHEREQGEASGRLLRLEAQVLQQLGRFHDAIHAARRAVEVAEGAADFAAAAEAALLLALACEAVGDFGPAAEQLVLAREWASDLRDDRLLLRLLASTMRLKRKSNASADEIEEQATYISALLTSQTIRGLRSTPTVLRELLAEMGTRDLRLLQLGLDTFGIDLPSQKDTRRLASSLAKWARDAGSTEAMDLAIAHGVVKASKRRPIPSEEEWARWLWSSSPRDVAALVKEVIVQPSPHESVMVELATLFRGDVDRRVTRGTRQRAV